MTVLRRFGSPSRKGRPNPPIIEIVDSTSALRQRRDDLVDAGWTDVLINHAQGVSFDVLEKQPRGPFGRFRRVLYCVVICSERRRA